MPQLGRYTQPRYTVESQTNSGNQTILIQKIKEFNSFENRILNRIQRRLIRGTNGYSTPFKMGPELILLIVAGILFVATIILILTLCCSLFFWRNWTRTEKRTDNQNLAKNSLSRNRKNLTRYEQTVDQVYLALGDLRKDQQEEARRGKTQVLDRDGMGEDLDQTPLNPFNTTHQIIAEVHKANTELKPRLKTQHCLCHSIQKSATKYEHKNWCLQARQKQRNRAPPQNLNSQRRRTRVGPPIRNKVRISTPRASEEITSICQEPWELAVHF